MIDKSELQKAPSQTGIYIFYEKKTPIYVGKAVNIKARLFSHLKNAETDKKESIIITKATKVDWQIVDSEFKALLLEAELIKKFQSKYNLILKDDKSQLYIKITSEEFPKVHIVRREDDGKSQYYGPFSSCQTVSLIVRNIRKVIPFCTSNKTTKRKCFYSKIGLCDPCPNYINTLQGSDRIKYTKEYLNNIRKLKRLLSGKTQGILLELNRKIKNLSKSQNYEEAINLRNKLQSFQKLLVLHRDNWGDTTVDNMDKSKIEFNHVLSKYFSGQDLDINNTRIECYDVSNISGEHATASMVVFENFSPLLSEYRKFKIKTKRRTSDPYLMREVLIRRFNNKWKLPALIILDGGRPQLRAFQKLIKDDEINPIFSQNQVFPIIGLAKNPDRLISGWDLTPINTREIPNLFNTIKQLRDESHRFAKKYHVLLRSQALKMI